MKCQEFWGKISMFLNLQNNGSKKEYMELLQIVGSLSGLFSDANIPYLYYRAAENIFCKAFQAENLSRSDCSVDASKDNIGIGLKTFLNNNGRTYQKIAEFNKDRNLYINSKNIENIVLKVANMRNKRIESTMAIHGIHKIIYHCVAREENKFLIFEEEMDYIDTKSIDKVSLKGNSLTFKDSINEYNFNLSKSTLMKRFYTPENVLEVNVNILDNPFDLLQDFYYNNIINNIKQERKDTTQHVILPLYSPKYNKVMEKSGLNQWNASGRERAQDEVYIPVPMIIHKKNPYFFPLIDKSFNLILPNKKIISAKMCQNAKMELDGTIVDKGKGLMSNPNTDLGKWILRDILKIPVGQLVTMEDLYSIGIDSVEIRKIDEEYYKIDFKAIGSYEEFILEN